MSTIASAPAKSAVVYPESDGLPMADNTKQFHWIVTIKGGLDAVFRNEPNVFVAGNLFWYPVEGDNTIRVAPDIFVVFGRPKGDRGSYMQWVEDNVAPQVAFEVLSPGNRHWGSSRRREKVMADRLDRNDRKNCSTNGKLNSEWLVGTNSHCQMNNCKPCSIC